jgi:predicted patatin/cPLA2 family phospholipase
MNQFADLFKQYLENFSHLEEELKKQWEPRLRQKEQQLRQQTGQEINMTPEQDPEFVQVLNDQLKRLEDQYAGVIKQGKDQIKQLV